MKQLLVLVLAGALLSPAAATAKGPVDAKVMFTPAPVGLKAGQAWKARFWFLFRNGEPYRVSGLRPTVTIRNATTGASRVFSVVQDDSTYYSARIVFPFRGRWTVRFRFDPNVGGGASRLLTTLLVS